MCPRKKRGLLLKCIRPRVVVYFPRKSKTIKGISFNSYGNKIKCKRQAIKYKPINLTIGDTPEQLLARSSYILFKIPWTKSQMQRAYLLFQRYPSIEQVYCFHRDFKNIYPLEGLHNAKTALVEWIKRAQDSSIEYFQSVAESLFVHWESIVAFFANPCPIEHAECLNA